MADREQRSEDSRHPPCAPLEVTICDHQSKNSSSVSSVVLCVQEPLPNGRYENHALSTIYVRKLSALRFGTFVNYQSLRSWVVKNPVSLFHIVLWFPPAFASLRHGMRRGNAVGSAAICKPTFKDSAGSARPSRAGTDLLSYPCGLIFSENIFPCSICSAVNVFSNSSFRTWFPLLDAQRAHP